MGSDAHGAGQWTCREGFACAKGGLNLDGTLKVFVRASAYKYASSRMFDPTLTREIYRRHMAKHDKPHCCEACGREFTRREHVLRHMATQHGV